MHYSKLFKKVVCKLHLLWYQTCHDLILLMICSRTTNFIPIWKVSCKKPTVFRARFRVRPWYMIIFLHIKTPWINQYCFICSSPCSTNLVILLQATICKYYMCKVWTLSNEYFLHDIHFKSSSFPQFCVQSYGSLTHRRFTHQLHPYHNLHFDA